jgi:hypothetical protein
MYVGGCNLGELGEPWALHLRCQEYNINYIINMNDVSMDLTKAWKWALMLTNIMFFAVTLCNWIPIVEWYGISFWQVLLLRVTSHTSQGPDHVLVRALNSHPKPIPIVWLTWYVGTCIFLTQIPAKPWNIIYSLPCRIHVDFQPW